VHSIGNVHPNFIVFQKRSIMIASIIKQITEVKSLSYFIKYDDVQVFTQPFSYFKLFWTFPISPIGYEFLHTKNRESIPTGPLIKYHRYHALWSIVRVSLDLNMCQVKYFCVTFYHWLYWSRLACVRVRLDRCLKRNVITVIWGWILIV
jgi:hypothetical protein